ncbi:unnamed protein product [Ostreobium quekettii]|uniref:Uncharacterized protein n=1 Tax=Ostreobium quekettii TaxID=121088 RepID=A0A8S1ISE5_9CHLO|nr:unnamed protein product [Ostreobium quekettii]
MKWFLKDTDDPFCVYQKDVLLCSDREGEDCADDCEIKRTLTALTSTEECVPGEEVLLELGYEEGSNLKQRVGNGIAVCPTLQSSEQCLNYL